MISAAALIFLYLLPIPLGILCWRLYLLYIRSYHLNTLEWTLLEIKAPREIFKSPQAMEVVLMALHQPSEGSLIDKYVNGRLRAWFSLEMVSLGGSVHFYIRTQTKFKNLIESQIYSQYPGIEVHEVDDYTQFVPSYQSATGGWSLWGVEYQLTKPDPYPIKTYVDYGLDKDPKEEFKIDPITPIIEMLGSVGPGEQIWIQIPLMATRERFKKDGTWNGWQDWTEEGKKEIKKIMDKYAKKGAEGELISSEGSVPKSERDVIEAISRSITKPGFDCGVRMIYLAPADNYQSYNIARMTSSMKQFSAGGLNGFKPLKTTSFDYPWQDPWQTRVEAMKKKIFEAYRRRAYFFKPFYSKPMVLNTEELATIFHFPGQVAETPTLGRIESKRGEPPVNLPI